MNQNGHASDAILRARWYNRLLGLALRETSDLSEAIAATGLAVRVQPLPDEGALLAIEDAEGNLHSEKTGRFVGAGLFGQPVAEDAKGRAGFKVLSALKEGKGEKATIDPRELIPSEKGSSPDKARRMADVWDKSKASVKVFEIDGKHYIFDGHHTVAAAILRGEKELPITVIRVGEPKLSAYFSFDIFNRKAQGILNRAMAAAKNLSLKARHDLKIALTTKDAPGMGQAVVEFVHKYRAHLADLLGTTQLASLLEGAREVASKLPPIPMAGTSAPPPPSLPPEDAAKLLNKVRPLPPPAKEGFIYRLPPDQQAYVRQTLAAELGKPPVPPPPFRPAPPAAGSPERIHYPIIEEAAAELSEKNVVTRQVFDRLDDATRAKAFTVAGVDAQDTLIKIRDTMAENIAEGADLEAFRKKVLLSVDEGTFLSEGHLENVFRTNIQASFSDGQMGVLNHPFVRTGFPYAAYEAIEDDRVRQAHLDLSKLGIAGSNIYRINDPVFQTFRPPWDFQCVPWNSQIITEWGRLPISEVKKGDFVFTHRGRFRRVLGTHFSESAAELVTVQLESGSFARATAQHRILTQRGWVEMSSLNFGDEVQEVANPPLPYLVVLEVDDRFEVESRADGGITLSIGPSGIMLEFNANGESGKEKVKPKWKGLLVEHKLDTPLGKTAGECLLMSAHADDSVYVHQWVQADRVAAARDHLRSHFGAAGSANNPVCVADFFSALGVESVMKRSRFGAVSQRDIMLSEHPLDRAVGDASCQRDVNDTRLVVDVISNSAIDAARVNRQACLGILQIGSRTFWLFPHSYNCNMTKSRIKSVEKSSWKKPVHNLSVEDDESYVCDGVVMHNCRCSWIPLTVRHAADQGLAEAKQWLDSGVEPSPPAFVTMPPFQPPPGFRRALVNAPLSIRLSLMPLEEMQRGALFSVAHATVSLPVCKARKPGKVKWRGTGKRGAKKAVSRVRVPTVLNPGVRLGMVGDEWHGPQPPGEGWAQIAPGPKGGLRWRKSQGQPASQEKQGTVKPPGGGTQQKPPEPTAEKPAGYQPPTLTPQQQTALADAWVQSNPEGAMAAMGVKKVDLTGLPAASRATVAKWMREKFMAGMPLPRAVKVMDQDTLKSVLPAGSPHIQAAYDSENHRMIINSDADIWRKPDKHAAEAKQAEAEGLISSSHPSHPFDHEYGHFLHHTGVGDTTYMGASMFGLGDEEKNTIKSQVSKYAGTGRGEMVAETFAGMTAGKKYSPEVMAIYQKYGGPALPAAPKKEKKTWWGKLRSAVGLGMVGGEWHGPQPPGEGWVQVGAGPQGGKRWKKQGSGDVQDQGQRRRQRGPEGVTIGGENAQEDFLTTDTLTKTKGFLARFKDRVDVLTDRIPGLATVKSGLAKVKEAIYGKLQKRYGTKVATTIMVSGTIGGFGVAAGIAAMSGGLLPIGIPFGNDLISIAGHTFFAEMAMQAGLLKKPEEQTALALALGDDEDIARAVKMVGKQLLAAFVALVKQNKSAIIQGVRKNGELVGELVKAWKAENGAEASLGMVGDEWHGPEAPGSGWVQTGVGPKGGKVWKQQGAKTNEQEPAPQTQKGSGTKEDPFRCGSNIALAAKLLSEGHHVRLKQPEQVATLLDKMNEMIQEAMTKGESAPEFDLCRVTAKDTNLFCQHSLGIPRIKMPQMRGIPVPGTYAATKLAGKKSGKVDLSAEFIQHLKDRGIATEQTAIRASHLRASQSQIVGARVVQLINETNAGKRDLREKPIFVTQDNYIVDGHHHWAAIVGHGYAKDKDMKIPVYRLHMDIGQALDMANDFTKKAGLAPKAGATAALGMVGDEWHGPTPPSEGWTEIEPGPRGGNRWKKSGGETAEQPTTKKTQTQESTPAQETPAPAQDKTDPVAKVKSNLSNSPIKAQKKLGDARDHVNAAFLIDLASGERGVFKPASGEEHEYKDDEGNTQTLRAGVSGPFWVREVATSRVAEILGFSDLVPVTVKREVEGDVGSVQNFVDGATEACGYYKGNPYDGKKDSARAAALDYLICHLDRHTGNWLLRDDKLVLIDNGLAFPTAYHKEDFFNMKFWNRALLDDAKIPDLSAWRGRWDEIENALTESGLEPEAVALTKQRYDSLLQGSQEKKLFADLPGLVADTLGKTVRSFSQ